MEVGLLKDVVSRPILGAIPKGSSASTDYNIHVYHIHFILPNTILQYCATIHREAHAASNDAAIHFR